MAEPANRKDRPGGGKYYEHPLTGEKFDSVTTILDLVDKAALKIWAAGLAADMAMDSLPQLQASFLVPVCGNTYNRCYQKHGPQARCERCPCGDCENCWHRRLKWRHSAESSRRAQEGTEAHEAIDFWVVNGGREISVRKEVAPYFGSFKKWVRDYGLAPRDPATPGSGSWEQTEVTLINRTHMYAGTSDGAVWVTRGTKPADLLLDQLGGLPKALVRVDYKTREKPDEALYYDMPLQGVAYERCEWAMLPDGSEHEVPKTDARYVLQLRPITAEHPDGYSFKPMLTDGGTFEAFLGILTAYRWMNGAGKKPFEPQPLPTLARAVETVETILDAEVIDDGLVLEPLPEPADDTPPWDDDPDMVNIAPPQPDPWPDPVQAYTSTDPTPPPADPLPELSMPPPPRKRAAKPVSATQSADPFTLANPTVASMSASTFKPGPRQASLLDEDIPF